MLSGHRKLFRKMSPAFCSSKFITYNLLPFLFFLSSCGVYSFSGASISPDTKTVSIQYFPNNAPLVQATLSQVFTERLRDKFVNQTNLSLVTSNGDLRFEGAIVDYRTQPMAIQSTEQAAMTRLYIGVNVKFINTKDEKMNFEKVFTQFEDYESSLQLISVEDELIKKVTDKIVGDVFNQAVVNW